MLQYLWSCRHGESSFISRGKQLRYFYTWKARWRYGSSTSSDTFSTWKNAVINPHLFSQLINPAKSLNQGALFTCSQYHFFRRWFIHGRQNFGSWQITVQSRFPVTEWTWLSLEFFFYCKMLRGTDAPNTAVCSVVRSISAYLPRFLHGPGVAVTVFSLSEISPYNAHMC